MLTVRTLQKKVREIDIATKDELRQTRIFQLGTRGRRIGFGVRWHLADAELLSSCGLLLGLSRFCHRFGFRGDLADCTRPDAKETVLTGSIWFDAVIGAPAAKWIFAQWKVRKSPQINRLFSEALKRV